MWIRISTVIGIRIRIHKAPEYGSNADPDPQHLQKHAMAKH